MSLKPPSLGLLSIASIALLGACAADIADTHEFAGHSEALSSGCIVRGDDAAFELDLALKYFKWNGTTHSSAGLNRIANEIEDLRDKLADETDAAKRDTLDRRISNGLYLLRYQAFFVNSSGKISKNKVKQHDPTALSICDDAGCEDGADEDERFVHHAYRSFSSRDATSAELDAALAALPDRTAAGYDDTDDYREEIAAWIEATFTASACDSAEVGGGIIDPSTYYRRLARFALHRDATDALFTTQDFGNGQVIVIGGSCEAQMSTAYNRTILSAEYLSPDADSYRYNLNPDATPSSCPTSL